MAKVIQQIGVIRSRSNVLTSARAGTTWRGFAAPVQPKRPRGAAVHAQWSAAVTLWRTLSPDQQYAWGAIAPTGRSGYGLFVQAHMRALKNGSSDIIPAPATFPTFALITDPTIYAESDHLIATWTYTSALDLQLLIQIYPWQTANQLSTAAKSWINIVQWPADDPAILLDQSMYRAFGRFPTACTTTVRWTMIDTASALTGPSLTTRINWT